MGSFSTLSATNNNPQKGKPYPRTGMEVITVKKYGWSFIQKSLCAYSKIVLVKDVYLAEYEEDEENPDLSIIVGDTKKGIVNFEQFFLRLKDLMDIDADLVSNSINYLYTKIKKYRLLYLDSRDFFGMGPGGPNGFNREQMNLMRQCQETTKGADYIYNRSTWSKWLKGPYAVQDINTDLEWMVTDISSKRRQGWG